MGGRDIIPKQDDPEWKLQEYRVTNLSYDMLCEPTISDKEEKQGDNLSSNTIISLQILITNIEKTLVY